MENFVEALKTHPFEKLQEKIYPFSKWETLILL
jgi:hypothetical protein